MKTKTMTQTQTVTTTHLAIATLALIGASAVALAAAPRAARQVPPIEQCQPMRAEFSRPCAGAAGFRQISFNCPSRPNVRKTSLRSPNCRSEEALVAAAARNCQNARRCAAVAPPAAVPGYGYNQGGGQVGQAVTMPRMTFSEDSPTVFTFAPGENSLVAKVDIQNPNATDMVVSGMTVKLSDSYAYFFPTSTGRDMYIEVGGTAVIPQVTSTASVSWNPVMSGEGEIIEITEAQFGSHTIPAQSSRSFKIYLDTQHLEWSKVRSLLKVLISQIRWQVGQQTGTSLSTPNEVSREIIRPLVKDAFVSWAGDTPSGSSVPNAEQLIGKIIVTNPASSLVPLEIGSVGVVITVPQGVSTGFGREIIKIYDENGSLIGQDTLATIHPMRTWAVNVRPNAPWPEIQPGASKTFFLKIDTVRMHSWDVFTIDLDYLQTAWEDKGQQVLYPFAISVEPKTFTY